MNASETQRKILKIKMCVRKLTKWFSILKMCDELVCLTTFHVEF